MIALDTQIEKHLSALQALLPVAVETLRRYCLEEAGVEHVSAGDPTLFRVDMPVSTARFHPYLGRITGQRFMLRIRPTAGGGLAATESEVAWLASLLRDTDLPVPEPVPTCDGALFPSFWVEGVGEMHSVMYKWI